MARGQEKPAQRRSKSAAEALFAVAAITTSASSAIAQVRYVDEQETRTGSNTPQYRANVATPQLPSINLSEGEDMGAKSRHDAFERDQEREAARAERQRRASTFWFVRNYPRNEGGIERRRIGGPYRSRAECLRAVGMAKPVEPLEPVEAIPLVQSPTALVYT